MSVGIETNFTATEPAARVAIRWPKGCGVTTSALPVAFGVTLPQGKVMGDVHCTLLEQCEVEIPAQGEVLRRWADGSVRWLLLHAVVPAGTELDGAWELVVRKGQRPAEADELRVTETDHFVSIGSDRLQVRFSRERGSWQASLDEVVCDDNKPMGPLASGRSTSVGELPLLTDEHGQQHQPVVHEVRVVAAGPVRATVEVWAEYPQVKGLRLKVRWSFFADTGLALADVTLHNPRRARHAGGLWDLGDAGSVLLKQFSLPMGLVTADDCRVWYRCEPQQDWREAADGHFEVHQESSGGESWDSHNHVALDGSVPLRYAGYKGRAGDQPFRGQRATPVVAVESTGGCLAAAIPEFWQQFPKGMTVDGCRLNVRLFPESASAFELQGGEQKTQRIAIELAVASDEPENSPAVSTIPQLLSKGRIQPIGDPVIPGMPSWAGASPTILSRLDELAEEFLGSSRGLLANRERVDEYGWRNYGDVHADHEELHYRGPQPQISHYNNQFDLLAGFLLQYLRTGEVRWWELADPLARHVIDIDIYNTTEDRPAYNGGLFWFTDHYLHAHTSTHRTYSRHNRPASGDYGGGPAASHCFSTGLLLYHLLTGDPQAKAAVVSLADWVLAMDDGTRTILGLVDDGATGLASATADLSYHGPGRGAGNSINALLDGWLATANPQYLNYAEVLIRRSIHPREDIAARELLNAEKRWSYTVFLVSLDKYLRCKAEAGQSDAMFGYAQESLLSYGRWMLAHEQPYLDRCHELEYPTEAWPAQELRKANVLRLSAAYAAEDERTLMFDRGEELAERAWKDLQQFSTRTTARAMAIVLTEGLRDAELRRRNVAVLVVSPPTNVPAPESFVPQRERIKRKLRSPAGIVSLLWTAANPARWPRLLNHR